MTMDTKPHQPEDVPCEVSMGSPTLRSKSYKRRDSRRGSKRRSMHPTRDAVSIKLSVCRFCSTSQSQAAVSRVPARDVVYWYTTLSLSLLFQVPGPENFLACTTYLFNPYRTHNFVASICMQRTPDAVNTNSYFIASELCALNLGRQ